jgi:hypothetical protein
MDVFIRDSPQKSRVILIVTVIHLEVVKAVDLEAAFLQLLVLVNVCALRYPEAFFVQLHGLQR